MSDQSGFVKLPRELFFNNKKSPLYGHVNAWAIFCAILTKVRFGDTPTDFVTCWGSFPIQPKEFLLNQKQLTWESGLPRRTVRDCVKKLEKLGMIMPKQPPYPTAIDTAIPPRHRVPVLYALADKYYDMIYNSTPPYPTAIDTAIGDRHLKKKEEEKENKEIKNKENNISLVSTSVEVVTTEIVLPTPETPKIKRQSIQLIPTDLQTKIAKEWLRIAFSHYPWREDEGKWTVDSFAQDLCKVQKKLKLSDQQLEKIFEIYQTSNFWQDKVFPSSLLKKTEEGMMKIEYLMREETKKFARARRNEEFLAKYIQQK